jgi:hypothetical protein
MIEMKMECGHGSVVEVIWRADFQQSTNGLWLAGWLARINFRSTPRFIDTAKPTRSECNHCLNTRHND